MDPQTPLSPRPPYLPPAPPPVQWGSPAGVQPGAPPPGLQLSCCSSLSTSRTQRTRPGGRHHWSSDWRRPDPPEEDHRSQGLNWSNWVYTGTRSCSLMANKSGSVSCLTSTALESPAGLARIWNRRVSAGSDWPPSLEVPPL